MSKPIKYTDSVDIAWAKTAVDRLRVTPLPDGEDPIALRIEGGCPRCNDHMSHTHYLIAYRGVAPTSPENFREAMKAVGAMDKALLPAEFSIKCCCQEKHPDDLHRKGLVGCGAIWKMRVEEVGE